MRGKETVEREREVRQYTGARSERPMTDHWGEFVKEIGDLRAENARLRAALESIKSRTNDQETYEMVLEIIAALEPQGEVK